MTIDTLLQSLVTEWNEENTLAIGLTGSHARGDAIRYSDVDLWRIVATMPDNPEAEYALYQRESFLISVNFKTFDGLREAMTQPQKALFAVPGIRQVRALLDKTGDLAQIIEEAKAFRWETLQAQADLEAGYHLYGLAEEVHKIMNGLAQADDHLMIYGIYGLVINLTHAVALHRGVMVLSENNYFRQVEQAVGADSAWSHEHRLALGLRVASPSMRARAGLRLYRETAALLDSILQPEHRSVVEYTLKQLARFVE
jgi:hypothetical protein